MDPLKGHRVLIQMSGAPGSGKSTMAKLLRESIGGLVIDHDVIRSSLLQNSGSPFNQAARAAYSLQWAFADSAAAQGIETIIIDSTCNYQEVLDNGSELARRYGLAYWYVECMADDIGLLDRRLRARDPMRSQRTGVDQPPTDSGTRSTVEDSHALFRRWIDAPCRPACNVIVVDSTGDMETAKHQVLRQIFADTVAALVPGPGRES